MLRNSIRLPHLGRVQRVIVLVLAVTGIIVGLLAMHTLTVDHASHTAVSGVELDHAMAHPGADGRVPDAVDAVGMDDEGECAGACDPGHAMASLACLLALIILTLTVALRVATAGRGDLLHRILAASTAALPHSQAAPRPPSLHVLSISRT